MALTNIPIDITEVADELVSGDILFSVYDLEELEAVAPFDGMKPGPENFPGSMILRRCTKGRVLCRQGEAGATAFQILTREDAFKVLRAMLRGLSAEESAFDEALKDMSADVQSQVGQLQRRRDALRRGNIGRRQSLEHEVERLTQTLKTSDNTPGHSPPEVVHARLFVSSGNKRKGLLHRLMDKLCGRSRDRSGTAELPEYIPNDGLHVLGRLLIGIWPQSGRRR